MPKSSRLDQLLSSLGYCTRSQVRGFISQGRVRVKGREKLRPEMRVESSDVSLDGAALDHPDGLLLMLHKPVGYVCTHSGEEGPTVFSLLPERWNRRSPKVVSIGRLDKDTSGLLLLTDQHRLVHDLTSPKKSVGKTYEAELDQAISEEVVKVFASGSLLLKGEKKPCLPARLTKIAPRKVVVEITEGRYHQVRRMFAACGLRVEKLHRSRLGSLSLEGLAVGEWRSLALDSFQTPPKT